jgi:oxygen-independent coproporphyrinogen-3 oxidase
VIVLQINIHGLTEEKFHRPLTNIANLFFEETKVFMANHSDQAELTVNFVLKVTDWVHVHAEIPGCEPIHANYEKAIPDELTQKEKDRMIKNAISYVYLSVLQTYTGMTQKWGLDQQNFSIRCYMKVCRKN